MNPNKASLRKVGTYKKEFNYKAKGSDAFFTQISLFSKVATYKKGGNFKAKANEVSLNPNLPHFKKWRLRRKEVILRPKEVRSL